MKTLLVTVLFILLFNVNLSSGLKQDSVRVEQMKVLEEDAGEIFHQILLNRLKNQFAFESRSNFHVTGNFHLPKQRNGKIPGIYIMSGHSDIGKAAETYHVAATLFAVNGFVAFITGSVCQFKEMERRQIS